LAETDRALAAADSVEVGHALTALALDHRLPGVAQRSQKAAVEVEAELELADHEIEMIDRVHGHRLIVLEIRWAAAARRRRPRVDRSTRTRFDGSAVARLLGSP